MTTADDIIQALAAQRNQHADDAAGLFADLMAARREIDRLTKELAAANSQLQPATGNDSVNRARNEYETNRPQRRLHQADAHDQR